MKKRIFCLLLISVLALASCSNSDSADTTAGESTPNVPESVTHSGTTAPEDDEEYIEGSDIDVNYSDIDLLIAACAEEGVSVKEVKGDVGSELLKKLSSFTANGEKSEKISDEPFSFQHYDKCYAPIGTFWIKAKSEIYRIMPSGEVSKVADYYSEGDILEIDSGFLGYLDDLWRYYPRNTLCCLYKDGKTETRRVFDHDSETVIELVSLTVSKDATATNDANSMTVKVTSKVDKTVLFEAVPRYGKSDFAKVTSCELELKAGTSTEVTLGFCGWQDREYKVDVILDDSRISIEIVP